ncbi:MAG: NADH-quinone oxidoreductase subunit M, partial [Rickettsiales bacterium]|nr:NADH-quinone oxidoreductase subunit M [Rickettsiales bacterium]
MMHLPILSTLIFLPVIGALVLLCSRLKDNKKIFIFGLSISLFELLLTVILFETFNIKNGAFQFQETAHLIYEYDIKYYLGIDGMSLLLIALTAFLTPICLLISFRSITHRVKEYVVCFLLIESFVIGSFCALDLLLFYIFFEAMLIPMFLVIGIWGGKERIYASYKFFLYTLFGSVFFLVSIIIIYVHLGTTDIIVL